MSALTKALAYGTRSRVHGRHFVTCPSTRPTSIPSSWPSAHSKHFCARPPSERFRVFGEPFADRRVHGRHFVTCPSTRPTSIPSSWPSAHSKHFCARPPSERFRVFGEPFARSCHASVLENVPTTSSMRAMLQHDRETL